MARGEPLKSNDRGLLLRNMGGRTTKAPGQRDPSKKTLKHIRLGKPVDLELPRESGDARIRSITPQQ